MRQINLEFLRMLPHPDASRLHVHQRSPVDPHYLVHHYPFKPVEIRNRTRLEEKSARQPGVYHSNYLDSSGMYP